VGTGRAWKRFIWNKRKEARELTLKMETAERHYIQRGLRVALCKWVEWVQVCKRRQNGRQLLLACVAESLI
jgi:hypothetical protein